MGHGELVLVVDDELGVRTVAKAILGRAGFRVATVAGGEAALEAFCRDRSQIRVIVVDATMPIMDGLETLRRLRDLGCTAPVILSSGFNESSFEIEVSEAGFSSFLRKPYGPDDLVEAVSLVLDEGPQGRSSS